MTQKQRGGCREGVTLFVGGLQGGAIVRGEQVEDVQVVQADGVVHGAAAVRVGQQGIRPRLQQRSDHLAPARLHRQAQRGPPLAGLLVHLGTRLHRSTLLRPHRHSEKVQYESKVWRSISKNQCCETLATQEPS